MGNDDVHALRLGLFTKAMKTHFTAVHLELHVVFTGSEQAKVTAVEIINLKLRL